MRCGCVHCGLHQMTDTHWHALSGQSHVNVTLAERDLCKLLCSFRLTPSPATPGTQLGLNLGVDSSYNSVFLKMVLFEFLLLQHRQDKPVLHPPFTLSRSWIVSHSCPESFIDRCNPHPFTCSSPSYASTCTLCSHWNYTSIKLNLSLVLSTAPPI